VREASAAALRLVYDTAVLRRIGNAAFRQRFQLLFKIVNAVYADLMLTGYSRMKPEDKTIFSFLLALAGGRVLTVRNNQSAGQL